MNINDVIADSQWTLLNSPGETNQTIQGVFACDLLSHVMGFANEGELLVTVLNNINVLGVVHLLDLSGVVFPHNIQVQQSIIDKANELGIPLLSTSMTTADTVVALHKLGV
ncbi:DRTGG domain-containing protein [Candidatus Xianfuyuplasma coldseepsis]|uniref:DRTGG domain-containing protein n=1 Tax=Candidatus Xianfuyuplasma coldseepsis TaxID=2782163 RepID=A0A7L7KQE8_9MOLU|nr:DRTGG domain-containing protein [Xianfuyuplasma coldseepsis]QMS85021.1 hypothetical protein G4Z02_04380 [Xianfuyuplasma coldseepsis]